MPRYQHLHLLQVLLVLERLDLRMALVELVARLAAIQMGQLVVLALLMGLVVLVDP